MSLENQAAGPLLSGAGGSKSSALPGFNTAVFDNMALAVVIIEIVNGHGLFRWANAAFEELVGYTFNEIDGQDIQMMYGDLTDTVRIDQFRKMHAHGLSGIVTTPMYKKSGEMFWCEASLSPVKNEAGKVLYWIDLVHDVSERIRLERAMQEATTTAERNSERLEVLTNVLDSLSSATSLVDALNMLPTLVVPSLARWASINVLETRNSFQKLTVFHEEYGDIQGQSDSFTEATPEQVANSTMYRVLTGELGPTLISDLSFEILEKDSGRAIAEDAKKLGADSSIAVPIAAHGSIFGSLTLFAGPERPPYNEEDLAIVAVIAEKAAAAADRARSQQAEHEVSIALQRALLPAVDQQPGFDIAVGYYPSSEFNEVGGDWYDVFRTRDGALSVVVGDVIGHDTLAASAMGRLAASVRSFAWLHGEPGIALDHVDKLVTRADGEGVCATCVIVRIDVNHEAGHATLHYTKAGHPSPMVLTPDGRVIVLSEATSMPIGFENPDSIRGQVSVAVPLGSTLFCYTDGLIENRDHSLEVGLDLLASALTKLPHDAPAIALRDELLALTPSNTREDDVCLTVVRILPNDQV